MKGELGSLPKIKAMTHKYIWERLCHHWVGYTKGKYKDFQVYVEIIHSIHKVLKI
jgi:hypothetical protein